MPWATRKWNFRALMLILKRFLIISTILYSVIYLIFDTRYSRRIAHSLTASVPRYVFPLDNNMSINISDIYRPIRTKTLYPLTQSRDYLLNNISICDTEISILFIIHSAIDNFEQRQRVRSTYALRKRYLPNEVRVIFLLGRKIDNGRQGEIIREHGEHGDIIQGDFIDSYHNLTHKGVMGLRWVSENCRSVKYTIKLDDDAVFDTKLFFDKMFEKYGGRKRTMWCTVCYRSGIFREGKWKVRKDEFKGYKRWPWAYCAGFAVIITGDLPPALYRSSLASPFFWIDDVYLFGMLPHRVGGVGLKSLPPDATLQPAYTAGVSCLRRGKGCQTLTVGAKTRTEFDEVWNLMTKRH
ncbi:beta-1,3-galactosyltransferase 1-like [Patella vulgata]|uniref:beta-1,3-galactosyltransferase 1-like n=1 Tax=Patella vulgata TaxID=6465 RepID=UPI00217FE56F|nr:beta-1,3-galactosyltransferase 1-like [Patella vulgata]